MVVSSSNTLMVLNGLKCNASLHIMLSSLILLVSIWVPFNHRPFCLLQIFTTTLFSVFSVYNLALCTCQGNLCVSVCTSHHAFTLAGLGYESLRGSDPVCLWYLGSSTVCRVSSPLLGVGYFCRLEPFRRSRHEDLLCVVLYCNGDGFVDHLSQYLNLSLCFWMGVTCLCSNSVSCAIQHWWLINLEHDAGWALLM